MSFSVNTNTGAMVALQYLNQTQGQLAQTQSAINSGMKVATARDNGAIYAIAQNERAQVAGYQAVTSSLNNGTSSIDVALSAGQSISDLLIQMKQQALSASDASLDTASRQALNSTFQALVGQITTIVTVASAASISTMSSASTLVATIQTSLTNVDAALAKLSSGAAKFSIQGTFSQNLSDTLTTGIGNLVDANMAQESASLQALQVKQQLGIQALSIANQAPQSILSLFQGG